MGTAYSLEAGVKQVVGRCAPTLRKLRTKARILVIETVLDDT